MRAKVRFKLRPYQEAAFLSETRFEVRVWHRRAGKTFYTLGRQFARALKPTRSRWRAYYLAPTRVQAKGIAWDMLKGWASRLDLAVNESELRVDFPGGARLQLLGAETYDSLRGRYADDLVLDETALIPSVAWSGVLSPMLADREGRATFVGTPMGRMNLFHDLWTAVETMDDPEWSRSLLTHRDTGALSASEIKRMRLTMPEAEFAQELECSWDAALRGSYYAREMARAEAEGRITTVRHDAALPVLAAVDLGWSDAMVVGFFQVAGTEIRIIRCESYEHTSIPDMLAHWRTLPFPIAQAILPHDARVTELGSGMVRQEIFHKLGVSTKIAAKQGRDEGIAAVSLMLRNTWFDAASTRMLREALSAYRSEYDEVRGVHRLTPVHDWSSHYADMMRYLALGRPASGSGWGDNSALYEGLSV